MLHVTPHGMFTDSRLGNRRWSFSGVSTIRRSLHAITKLTTGPQLDNWIEKHGMEFAFHLNQRQDARELFKKLVHPVTSFLTHPQLSMLATPLLAERLEPATRVEVHRREDTAELVKLFKEIPDTSPEFKNSLA